MQRKIIMYFLQISSNSDYQRHVHGLNACVGGNRQRRAMKQLMCLEIYGCPMTLSLSTGTTSVFTDMQIGVINVMICFSGGDLRELVAVCIKRVYMDWTWVWRRAMAW